MCIPGELLYQLLDEPDSQKRQQMLAWFPITCEHLLDWKKVAEAAAFRNDKSKALQIASLIAEVTTIPQSQPFHYWTVGNIYHVLKEDRKAWEQYSQARILFLKHNDSLNLGRMNVGVIGCLIDLGKYEQAAELAQTTSTILSCSPLLVDQKRATSVMNNWGIACEYLGQYEEAIEKYEQKLRLWHQWADDEDAPIQMARTRINLGVVKKRLNLWSEAEVTLRTGIQMLNAVQERDQYLRDIARAKIHLVDIAVRRGDATDIIRQRFADAYQSRATISETSPDLIYFDLIEIRWLLQQDDVSTDIPDKLNRVKTIGLEAGQVREAIWAELLWAQYHTLQKEYADAVSICTNVIQSAIRRGDRELAYQAQYELGCVYQESGEPQQCLSAWKKAVLWIETMGKQVISGELRSGFLADKLGVYQRLTAYYLANNDLEAAFHWVERARARELVEVYTATQKATDALFYHEDNRVLWQELQQKRQEYAQSQENFQLEEQILTLSRRISRLEPSRATWLTGETAVLKNLQAALSPQQLFLLYTTIQNTLWVFPITSSGSLQPLALGFVPQAEHIEMGLGWICNMGQFRNSFVQRRITKLVAAARKSLAGWYEQLLAPLHNLLDEFPELIIAPDASLFLIPFCALIDAKTGHYLVETHQVSITPGATAWLWGQQRQYAETGFLALAYPGENLQNTVAEVQTIREIFPDLIVYTLSAATAERLQTTGAAQAAVIHLAAHAAFRGDNPIFSYIALADGRFDTLDILRLRLQAQLVTLSACETGLGLLRGGEYLGVPRAFLLAGAKSVLATQWTVDDTATAELMNLFYRHLAAGEPPARSLCLAQREMIVTKPTPYQHPYYWAPFFLFGSA